MLGNKFLREGINTCEVPALEKKLPPFVYSDEIVLNSRPQTI